MAFFDYPVYKIPDREKITNISSEKPVTVLVKKKEYQDNEASLLSKILKAVHLTSEEVAIIEAREGEYFKLEDPPDDRLILLFGLTPGDCSLQIDPLKYTIKKRGNNHIMFCSSLLSLPDLPEERRALWMELKRYFDIS